MSTTREEKTPTIELFLDEIAHRLYEKEKNSIERFKRLVDFFRANNFEPVLNNQIKKIDLIGKVELLSSISARCEALKLDILKLVSEPAISQHEESDELKDKLSRIELLVTAQSRIVERAFSFEEQEEKVQNNFADGPLPSELRPMWEKLYKNPDVDVKEYIGFMQMITSTYMPKLCDFGLGLDSQKQIVAADEMRDFKGDFEGHLNKGYVYSDEKERLQVKEILGKFDFIISLLTPVADKKDEGTPTHLHVDTTVTPTTFKTSSAAMLSSLSPVSPAPVAEPKSKSESPSTKIHAPIAVIDANYFSPRKPQFPTAIDTDFTSQPALGDNNRSRQASPH